MKRNKGVSLIELIVVCGIIAILASITIGMVKVSKERQVNNAVQVLDTSLKYARTEAMSKGNVRGLIIYKYDGQYYAAVVYNSSYNSATGTYNVSDESKYLRLERLGREDITLVTDYIDGTSVSISPSSSTNSVDSYVEFMYDKSSGAFKQVSVDGKKSYPDKMTLSYGKLTQTIDFNWATGNHDIIK